MRMAYIFKTKTDRQLLHRMCFPVALIVASFLLISCAATGQDANTPPAKPAFSGWPHDSSDLSPDKNVTFGRLENGLRYVIRQNRTPIDRVSMHLYVQVGSMFESDNEMGIAHFLEHMLFNGSTNFPPGEMVKYFQRIGMQFGPDANAHTGFDETVYDVLLPNGDPKSLSEGLLVLRDYADGALLLSEEVDKEKKVILAEMRSRDSARFRTLKATFRFEMPGLVISERFPIGEEQTIQQIDEHMLRDFYESWYRPERMVLVVVGDLNTQIAKEMIEKQFADLEAKRPQRPIPAFGEMTHHGIKAFHHFEQDAGATNVSIESITVTNEPPDSVAYQKEQMLRDITLAMMQKRLDDLVRREAATLTSAGIGGGYYLHKLHYAEISGHTDPKHWPKAAGVIEQELRKAIRYGFTAAELNRAKEDLKARLMKQKSEEGTRDSKTLARQVMGGIRNWKVLQSPSQRADLLVPVIEAVTVEQANKAFGAMWPADHRLVLVTGNAQIPGGEFPSKEKIKEIYLASSKTEVTPPVEKQLKPFPYLSVPARSAAVRKREVFPDLGVTRVLFDNGIHLFLKPTTFKKDQVLASLSFGGGRSSEPMNQPGLAKLAQAVINESGFSGMDRTALEDVLAGKLASTELDIREDRFVIKGSSTTKELPLLFQLMQASVLDPGFRKDARQLALKRFEQEYERLSKSVDGVMRLKGQSFLAGGDHRFGMPLLKHLQDRTLSQVKAWMEPLLREAPMELSLVGDFDVEQAIALASLYVGTLPDRRPSKTVLPVSGPVFPEGKTWTLPVQTETPKALVMVAFPTEDFWDIHRTRRLAVMAELYNEKLRQRIRENLGAAYSPYAYNQSFRAYKGYGMTQIFVQVDPKLAPAIVEEVRQIARQLREEVPDADEFRRILDPTLTYIKDLRQKNSYWLNSVLSGAARHPEQLDWARTFETDYAAIQKEEIAALARKYLIDERAAAIIFTPETDPSP